MSAVGLQVRDKWIPKEDVGELALKIIDHLKKGQNVVIHCYGGKGRTGTVLQISGAAPARAG
eukprot:819320-Prorocentrum_minimum.AAC.1